MVSRVSKPCHSVTTYNLTERMMKGTVVWLFWCKVLRLRNYRPIHKVLEINMGHKKPEIYVSYYFERVKSKEICAIHVSRYHGYHFTIASPGKVFTSEVSDNIGGFEDSFKKRFFRKLPILPPGVGTLPGNDY